MSLRYAIIGVEGPHDQAFVGKVLEKLFEFKRFNGKKSELDTFWENFIPTYPKNGDLYKRLDMPSILFTDNLSVAIYAGGGTTLGQNLRATIQNHSKYKTDIAAFGIVVDSDRNSPDKVAKLYCDCFQEQFPNFPEQAGNVNIDSLPHTGIYVLPDNINQGVLDTLLCMCGEIAYPEYINRASSYIASFSEQERKELEWSPFDHEKALIATVVSVLMPGQTNTSSVARNKWISTQTNDRVPAFTKFVEFIQRLLDLQVD